MPKAVDANQAEIVADLRKCGASVLHLHEVGYGCPDTLVGFRGQNFLIEIKTLTGMLNPCQLDWHGRWQGQVSIARSSEDALRIIGLLA